MWLQAYVRWSRDANGVEGSNQADGKRIKYGIGS